LYLESYTPGKQLVGSTFTLALVTGQMIWDRMKSSFQGGLRGDRSTPGRKPWRSANPAAPVRGERDVRDDQLQPGGDAEITSERTIIIYRRGYAPKIARISPGGDE
jgi:hypothetical protein